MSEVSISINGRAYEIGCDPGQEGRIVDLAAYIDQRLEQIARSGAAYNDAHLMVLTALVLADEVFDEREKQSVPQRRSAAPAAPAPSKEDEQVVVRLLDQITQRIDGIAQRVQAS